MRWEETKDLIAIWQEHDQEAWSQDAFQAIEEILIERLGELPERLTPIKEDEKEIQ